MIFRAVTKIAAFLVVWLLLLLPPGVAFAVPENRALDIKIHERPGLMRCVIRFKTHPAYLIKPTDADKIMVVFGDAPASEGFRREVAAEKDVVQIAETIPSPALGLQFSLPAPFQEISIARLTEEGAAGVYLEFPHGSTRPPEADSTAPEAVLQRINVGFTDMCTRLVARLNRRAPWSVSQGRLNGIDLRVKSIQSDLLEDTYGPADNLAKASLTRGKEHTEVSVRMLTRIDRIRVFWLKDTPMLVTDIFEGPPFAEEDGPVLTASLEDGPPGIDEGKEPAPAKAAPPPRDEEPKIVTTQPVAEEGGPLFIGRIDKKDVSSGASEAPLYRGSIGKDAGEGEIPEDRILEELEPEEALVYGQIRHSFENGNYEQTVKLCDHFLLTYPGSPMAEKVSFLKGDAEFGLVKGGDNKRFSSLIRTYQSAISSFRRSPKVQKAYLNMARASSLVGNDYAAIGYLNIVISGVEDKDVLIDALLERGGVYFKVNRHDKALEDYKVVLDEFPESPKAPEAEMGLARYFLEVGLNDKAEGTISRLLEDHPDFHIKHPEILFFRGKNAMYQKDYNKARDYFFRALNVGGQPESTDLLLARIGDTYHHSSLPREAEKYYRTVIREYPDGEGAAIAKLRLAGYQTGYSGFEDIRKENPDKPLADLATLEMARKYYEEKQFSKAMETLGILIDKPFKSEIVIEAKRLYYRTAEQMIKRLHAEGDNGALTEFYQAHKLDLRGNIDPEILLLVGLAFNEEENFSESIAVLEKIRPYDLGQVSKGQQMLALVNGFLKTGKIDQAVALLEKKEDRALLPASDRQKLDLELARIYQESGRSIAALSLYQKIVQGDRLLTDKEIAGIYLEMAQITSKQGNHEQAQSLANRCIGIAEASEENKALLRQAYAVLGNAYYREGRHAKAIESYDRAVKEGFSADDQGYWETRFRMAQAYLETGQFNLAEPMLVEISEQGDGLLQKRVRIRLGMLGLEKQLRRLSY